MACCLRGKHTELDARPSARFGGNEVRVAVRLDRAFARHIFAGVVFVVGASAGAGAALAAAGCANGMHPLPTEGENAGPTAIDSHAAASIGGAFGSEKAHVASADFHTNLRLGVRTDAHRDTLQELLANGGKSCPEGMALVDGRFCIDKYEATLIEILPNGEERPWSPFQTLTGHTVRAVSIAHAFPQAYVSGNEAAQACARSGKRLCSPKEWKVACEGPKKTQFGYGNERQTGRCNDNGKSAMTAVYGAPNGRMYWSMDRMNNPALNQVAGTLSKTGDHDGCTNGYGVYDMVGNLHEWVNDPKGTFQGGYYLDTHLNGDGCDYRTVAHEAWYHDYSTGFRCCSDEEL